jgi:hypothetical protein
MPGSWAPTEYPNATDQNCVDRSPATRRYNCIAWAAHNDARWWWPDALNIGYWPPNIAREETLDAFIRAFESEGYVPCQDGAHEPGFEKVALYATHGPTGDLEPTHAARQLAGEHWTSKIGPYEDIDHATLEALNSVVYGTAVRFLRKPI